MALGVPIMPLCSTLGGCITNSFALEMVMQESPKSGQLLNVYRFLVVGLIHYFERAFIYDSRNGGNGLGPIKALMPLSIPFSQHLTLVGIYLFMNVLNNAVFAFGISQALHVVIRSATPLANILVGFLFFSKRYSLAQCLCLIFITLGAAITTSAGAIVAMWTSKEGDSDEDGQALARYYIGMAFLVVAMLLTGVLAHFQEQNYKKSAEERPGSPRDWQEGLIYQNLFSLPFFVLAGSNLNSAARTWNASPLICYKVGSTVPYESNPTFFSYSISLLSLDVGLGSSKILPLNLAPKSILPWNFTFCLPRAWLYVMIDVLSMPICLRGVHSLTASAGGLKACVIMTLRKCLSLALSVAVFENRFTFQHWMGTFIVFAGSFIFSLLPSPKTDKAPYQKKALSKVD